MSFFFTIFADKHTYWAMRRFFPLFLFFAVTFCKLSAKSVVFVLTDSTKVYYVMDASAPDGQNMAPTIKFNRMGFTVGSDHYIFSKLDRFYFTEEDDPSDIASLSTSLVKEAGGCLIIETTRPVGVYTTDGKPMTVGQTRSASHVRIDLRQLGRGTYILKAGDTSIKFVRK